MIAIKKASRHWRSRYSLRRFNGILREWRRSRPEKEWSSRRKRRIEYESRSRDLSISHFPPVTEIHFCPCVQWKSENDAGIIIKTNIYLIACNEATSEKSRRTEEIFIGNKLNRTLLPIDGSKTSLSLFPLTANQPCVRENWIMMRRR